MHCKSTERAPSNCIAICHAHFFTNEGCANKSVCHRAHDLAVNQEVRVVMYSAKTDAPAQITARTRLPVMQGASYVELVTTPETVQHLIDKRANIHTRDYHKGGFLLVPIELVVSAV
jgi:hypothetical protein